MTNPARAVKQSGFGGRGYVRFGIDGPVLPSVTTILKNEAKPAIVQWAVNQTAAYAVANLDQLDRMSPDRGFGFLRWYWNRKVDPLSEETDVLNYHAGVLDDAAELGTAVHEWMQADVTGTTPYPDVSGKGHVFWECIEAWNAFRAEHDVSAHYTETTVWNEDDGYAGTFDGVWTIDGEHVLMDIKTSRGLYSSTWMQLAALYKAPIMLLDGLDGVDLQVRDWQLPVTSLKVLHVRPNDYEANGTFMPSFCKLVDMPGSVDTHYKSFKGLLTYAQAQRELQLEARK